MKLDGFRCLAYLDKGMVERTLLTDKFKIDMEAYRYPAAFVAFDCIYAEDQE